MNFKGFLQVTSVGISLVVLSRVNADEVVASAPAVPPTVGADADPVPVDPIQSKLKATLALINKGDLDEALTGVNAIIQDNPRNKGAYELRATIYARQKEWDKADYDYQLAHMIDPADATVAFNLAELKFMQKKYDEARAGFVDVQKDKTLGDFATYKVFLCDLFGSHEDVAAKELDAINQVGGNPSYYFGNLAWDLVHNNTNDATEWLKSASFIYANAPNKISNYASSLHDLGYLPMKTTKGT